MTRLRDAIVSAWLGLTGLYIIAHLGAAGWLVLTGGYP